MKSKIEDFDKFQATIVQANNIVITAHLVPDYDAVCSSLLLAQTLSHNFPEKIIRVVLEDGSKPGTPDVKNINIFKMPLLNSLKEIKADCIILLDTNRFDNVTRGDKFELLSYIQKSSIKTVVIDHHERYGEGDFAVRIQNPAIPAATQIVYQMCFQKLAYKRPSDIEHITMLGIVDDSGIFTYDYEDYSETFSIVNELILNGATVHWAAEIINQMTSAQMSVMGELVRNLKAEVDYTYSFISDRYTKKIAANSPEIHEFKSACTTFGNKYINAVDGKKWGFIVYKNLASNNNEYRVSFRSRANSKKDILAVTSLLGSGSGHEYAAGANIIAPNLQTVIRKVKHAIASL